MITSTNLNALRNLEHFQVMSNVLSYLKEGGFRPAAG